MGIDSHSTDHPPASPPSFQAEFVRHSDDSRPLYRSRALPDIEYAIIERKPIHLDLFLPEGAGKPPLIVYLHGGSWRNLDRKTVSAMVPKLVESGYAVASIDYRLSSQAIFPAQVHDARGAIRWLRAHAADYGYDPSRVFLMGTSAGAHVALLAGLTCAKAYFEGNTGGHLEQSSSVAAIVDFYGPTDFLLRARDQPDTTEAPDGKVCLLLGGPVLANPALAREASPAFHVSPDSPPILAFHGDMDQTVLLNQSERLVEACESVGHPVEFFKIPGGAHGDPRPSGDSTPRFYNTPENLRKVLDFLRRHS